MEADADGKRKARLERMRKWQAEKQKKAQAQVAAPAVAVPASGFVRKAGARSSLGKARGAAGVFGTDAVPVKPRIRMWSLEDDGDEVVASAPAGNDDVDPLDEYMSTIAAEAPVATSSPGLALRPDQALVITRDELSAGSANGAAGSGMRPAGRLAAEEAEGSDRPGHVEGAEHLPGNKRARDAGARTEPGPDSDAGIGENEAKRRPAAAIASDLEDEAFHRAFIRAMRGQEANGASAPAAVEAAGMRTAKAEQPFYSDDNGEGDDVFGFQASGDEGGDEEDVRPGGADVTLGTARKKELPPVDHDAMHYEPFRRDFYMEAPDLKSMKDEEVAALRKELEVQVHGKRCPKPISRWTQTGLSDTVLKVLQRWGYTKPFAIQAQALPAIMAGRDLIGVAKTGSGKTLAYVLPMLRHVLDQRPLDDGEGPIALVMVPTRELAAQVYKEAQRFAKPAGARLACIYGGLAVKQQIDSLKRGAEVVVCTPGRMIDMLTANNGRVTNLARVTFVVLDEADRMFDLGFEPQMKRILGNVRPDRQTVLFSATFPPSVEGLARKILKRPVQVIVGGVSVVADTIEQHVEVVTKDAKFGRLTQLLNEHLRKGQVIVFVDTHDRADTLFKDLASGRYPALSLHGRMDQSDRDSVIADFKTGARPLLVATSIAARGLDVRDLKCVINYDVPTHYEDYVHRVGRTGRAGRQGVAYTLLCPDEERAAPELVKALELANQPVRGPHAPGRPADSPPGSALPHCARAAGTGRPRRHGRGLRGPWWTPGQAHRHLHGQEGHEVRPGLPGRGGAPRASGGRVPVGAGPGCVELTRALPFPAGAEKSPACHGRGRRELQRGRAAVCSARAPCARGNGLDLPPGHGDGERAGPWGGRRRLVDGRHAQVCRGESCPRHGPGHRGQWRRRVYSGACAPRPQEMAPGGGGDQRLPQGGALQGHQQGGALLHHRVLPRRHHHQGRLHGPGEKAAPWRAQALPPHRGGRGEPARGGQARDQAHPRGDNSLRRARRKDVRGRSVHRLRRSAHRDGLRPGTALEGASQDHSPRLRGCRPGAPRPRAEKGERTVVRASGALQWSAMKRAQKD